MRIKSVPIESVIPYARNPRKHGNGAAAVAGSIKEFGWQQPIVVDPEMVVVAGHTRLAAAEMLGLDKVPIVVADGLTAQQLKAYRLADNRVAEESEWDFDLLKLEIEDLAELDYPLDMTGFAEEELSRLRSGTDGLTDEDNIPEPPEETRTQPGDVWCCGSHRVICGDSTDAATVAALLGDVKPTLMVTDPPYGVNYDADWRNRADRKNGKPYGARAIGKVENDDRSDWSAAWALFPGDVLYQWHLPQRAIDTARAIAESGFEIRAQIIWAKTRFAISRGHYHVQHEPCWYAVRNKGHWQGDRSQSTLWTIDHQKSETGHSTQKPVECMRRPILNNSSPGQAVYDPFLGSGTTMIAAETEGRVCYGIEISPAYVDLSVKRWEEFTGETAVKLDG